MAVYPEDNPQKCRHMCMQMTNVLRFEAESQPKLIKRNTRINEECLVGNRLSVSTSVSASLLGIVAKSNALLVRLRGPGIGGLGIR